MVPVSFVFMSIQTKPVNITFSANKYLVRVGMMYVTQNLSFGFIQHSIHKLNTTSLLERHKLRYAVLTVTLRLHASINGNNLFIREEIITIAQVSYWKSPQTMGNNNDRRPRPRRLDASAVRSVLWNRFGKFGSFENRFLRTDQSVWVVTQKLTEFHASIFFCS